MAEYSGFFNANEVESGVYDRIYNAEDFAKYFALFVGNGVFVNPSNQLKVVPKTGLTVTVKAGKAFIDGYWYVLDEDMDITLNVNGTANTVNDLILCVLDKSSRTISVTKRENASVLSPINNGTVHELVLAIVSVGVGVSSLTASNITDTRPDNTYCGYVGALIEQVDFGNLFDQMESQFNVWFDEMKGQLTTDAAGNLQTQIDDLDQKIDDVKTEVETSIMGNTVVMEWVYEETGGAYFTTSAVTLPDGFTKDNCYIKSAMIKKIEGTGAGILNEWTTGTNTFYTYASFDDVENTVRFGANMPNSASSFKGKYKIRIALEKVMNVAAG